MDLETLLSAIHADPADDLAWAAVADCLEERGEAERAELTRLTQALRRCIDLPGREEMEGRARRLLAAGVEPCVAGVTNSVGMRLACVPPGEFLMGSPEDEEGRSESEGPRHRVRISRGFHLGVFAVTQAEYARVMGKNPSHFSAGGLGKDKVAGLNTGGFPVEQVSHADAVKFCEKLSALPEEKGNKRLYRLPSEAEWEFSCRGGAGSMTPFHYGASLYSSQANFDGNYPYGAADKGPHLERTCGVGSYRPNAFGLYDMHGNVWEWCSDWYGADYYGKSPGSDPGGPSGGSGRVIRGGSWAFGGQFCRSAYRYNYTPRLRSRNLGFRVALVPHGQ